MKEFLLRKFSGEQPPTSLKVGCFTSILEDVGEISITPITSACIKNCLEVSGNRRQGRKKQSIDSFEKQHREK